MADEDFTITNFGRQLKGRQAHVDAGFDCLSESAMRSRFWQYLVFLKDCGFLVEEVVADESQIKGETSLKRSDLTDDGFSFIQKLQDNWIAVLDNRSSRREVAVVLKPRYEKWKKSLSK